MTLVFSYMVHGFPAPAFKWNRQKSSRDIRVSALTKTSAHSVSLICCGIYKLHISQALKLNFAQFSVKYKHTNANMYFIFPLTLADPSFSWWDCSRAEGWRQKSEESNWAQSLSTQVVIHRSMWIKVIHISYTHSHTSWCLADLKMRFESNLKVCKLNSNFSGKSVKVIKL